MRLRLKPTVFVLCLLPVWPLPWLLGMYFLNVPNLLGPDPVKYTLLQMGEWALKFLLITLAITPLRKITGWGGLAAYRRMLGLFAFFYAAMHLAVFFVFDLNLHPGLLLKEVARRPYIALGMAAFALLVPLALTSTNTIIKWMGGARWLALHRLVYAAVILAVLHFYWLKASKNLTGEPLIYGAVLALLLVYRVADAYGYAPRWPRKRRI